MDCNDMKKCPVCEDSDTSTSICAECAYKVSEIDSAELPDPEAELQPADVTRLKNILGRTN